MVLTYRKQSVREINVMIKIHSESEGLEKHSNH